MNIMNIVIKKAVDFDECIMEKIGKIFVEGFYDDALKYLSKDTEKLGKIFSCLLIPDYFYVAVIDNEIAGIASCVKKGQYCLKYDRKVFVKYLGILKGILAGFFSKLMFTNYLDFPLEINEETAIIEFVVTDKNFRKMGVASSIFNQLFEIPEYRHYVLEVIDANTPAIELYTKLGFKEIIRKEPSHKKYSGINYFVYMKYSKI